MCITVYYEKGRALLVFDFFFFYQFVKDGVHMRAAPYVAQTTGTRVHFVIFVIFIKIKYFPF
jgi:hypothetical protein